ncbi:MAG: class I SAM-dependent methyltransferase [bacterium]|nr:class I SAM-dependent methyltransferase [bacterium]
MYIKLDEEVERLLCCSMCKSELFKYDECFICSSCGLIFPKRAIKTNENKEEFAFDFRISHPTYCLPEGHIAWDDAQSEYKQYHERSVKDDLLKEYMAEIDSVREIYTDEYHIKGRVLDVGGHQGRLRQYLGVDVNLYVSVDPYINIFSGIEQQPNLLHAYSCLSKPCNFITAHAEYLPFKSGSFDWVHMRSVVDHFADPYLAFLEAYRCSRVGGRLLVGLTIDENKVEPATLPLLIRVAEKFKKEGFLGLSGAVYQSFRNLLTLNRVVHHEDDHMFRFTHGTLLDLFDKTGWDVIKEHWQKPPFQFCIYACGQKRAPLISTQSYSRGITPPRPKHHLAFWSALFGSERLPGRSRIVKFIHSSLIDIRPHYARHLFVIPD